MIITTSTTSLTTRYQISRDEDGEVNIDVVVGDTIPAPARSVVIDNKDYNYTLIISGQNIQVIQHDTLRNLTYKHGLDVSCLEREREDCFTDFCPSGESDISGGS